LTCRAAQKDIYQPLVDEASGWKKFFSSDADISGGDSFEGE
jgi:hypothetical protein